MSRLNAQILRNMAQDLNELSDEILHSRDFTVQEAIAEVLRTAAMVTHGHHSHLSDNRRMQDLTRAVENYRRIMGLNDANI